MASYPAHIVCLVFDSLRSHFVRCADRAAFPFDRRGAIAPPNIGFLCLKNLCLGGIHVGLYPIRGRVVLVGEIAALIGVGMRNRVRISPYRYVTKQFR
jgi:hypothetical protein